MGIEEIYYSNYDKIFDLSDYMLHCVGPVVHYRTLYTFVWSKWGLRQPTIFYVNIKCSKLFKEV